jgi:hypothetical protein
LYTGSAFYNPKEIYMFPVNLLIGGAIGSVVTYVCKDEKAKQWVIDTGKNFKEGSSSFIASFRKKPDEAKAATEIKTGEVVDVAPQVAAAAT